MQSLVMARTSVRSVCTSTSTISSVSRGGDVVSLVKMGSIEIDLLAPVTSVDGRPR